MLDGTNNIPLKALYHQTKEALSLTDDEKELIKMYDLDLMVYKDLI